jgi:hypothetical protein
MTFLKWEIGTQHLGEPSGFEGYGSKVEYGWTNKIGDIFEQTIQFLGQLFWIATKCKHFSILERWNYGRRPMSFEYHRNPPKSNDLEAHIFPMNQWLFGG